ncbi:kinase-like domain-containing protein [Neurospora tetraspora]|uniref:Kinase-like domain-containing protein n=1 Tax=Neurospora tetraspora TaxID=94610 RepID=A0AAE0MWZ9_9PEZI|nr:kinase-like domain-containing protein [Neurospora tetraspora]
MVDSKETSEFSEKTEAFSQSEIEARLRDARREREELQLAINSTVSLDSLVIPPDEDIRILVRPTRGRSVSPGPGSLDNCRWLALRAEVAEKDQTQHKVLAVTQTSRDIKFSVRIPGDLTRPTLWCELYYDPASDKLILVNRSGNPFILSRASTTALGDIEEYEVNPGFNKDVFPGTWRIRFYHSDVLDFRILEKKPTLFRVPSIDSSNPSQLVRKRSYMGDEGDENSSNKKPRASEDIEIKKEDTDIKKEDGVIMFLPAKTKPLVFPIPTGEKKELVSANGRRELVASDGNLLQIQPDETVQVTSGGCELDEYTLTKKSDIASSSLSSVFTADHSNVPDGVIVVKVLKTRTPATVNNTAMESRNVIHQADVWLRELQYQEDLQHKSIVRLYGGDARFLSLYMEHVDARDLASKGMWRRMENDRFAGDRSDAKRIVRDIASALHYIHGRGLVHNDIKPANILYSRERGAVLCDLGLSSRARDPPSIGGTPWYIPPEFIALKQRGTPSDVWALGVTMLYVMGKIAFPDARGNRAHPQHLHWLIAKVHPNPRDRNPQPSAVKHMQQWLGEVNIARAQLNTQDEQERLVYDMLSPNPNQRITMREIMARVHDQITEK